MACLSPIRSGARAFYCGRRRRSRKKNKALKTGFRYLHLEVEHLPLIRLFDSFHKKYKKRLVRFKLTSVKPMMGGSLVLQTVDISIGFASQPKDLMLSQYRPIFSSILRPHCLPGVPQRALPYWSFGATTSDHPIENENQDAKQQGEIVHGYDVNQ